jgi:hypothetical protein
MKLEVGMVKSSVVCPMSPFVNKAAMDPAFMSCHTMPQLLKLLLEFHPNFYHYDSFLRPRSLLAGLEVYQHTWVMIIPLYIWRLPNDAKFN